MRSIILVTMLLAVFGQTVPRSALASADSGQICASAVRLAEQQQHLPRLLLHAVSLTESGRWDDDRQASFAWPWTVTAEGKGRFFRSKAEAIAEVTRLRSAGVRNIDVGCMQINLMYHGAMFEDVAVALDPVHNVAYAAAWLKHLRGEHGSWAHAVGRYHTANWKTRGQDYWRKVRTLWTTEQKRDFRKRREARMQENLRRRTLASQ